MKRIGKYEILSELGRGGMGVVYKARDPFIDRLVALKTITGNLAGSTNLLERFYQEARSAGTLQHPNIVTIYELGEENGTPFIAMEYIEGETLEALIARKAPVPLAVKLGYLVRASEGLAYAHDHGVIHRDIKPGNIMVTLEEVAKIVDFGIARVMDTSMTQANLVIGSRAYMAPQLYKGERADARSDIWALGITLYEFLTYRKPFVSETEAGLMFKVLHEVPPPLRPLCPEASETLENIIDRMLEKEASARYQSVRDVIRDLGGLWKEAQEEILKKLLAECRLLIEAHEFRAAQKLLRKALQIEVTNTSAKALLDQVSKEVRRLEILPQVQDHLNRSQMHLQAGKLPEARKELDSALVLDSKSEPAHQLRKEIENAAKSAEQLEQQLRFAKRRLAEGALTEAREVLQEVSKLGAVEPRVQELRNQIVEEEGRRERRRQLSEVQDRARGLWMELKYAECLAVLDEGLKRFPDEEALLKLLETARQDFAEGEKQRQLAQARKLLAQQQFAAAQGVLEELAKNHPGDGGVNKLRILVEQGESEIRKQDHLVQEMAVLRKLVSAERFAEVVARAEPLLREYQQDFELKELVGYARGELAQQQLREKERELENQIHGLLQAKRYAEAATAAQQAAREFGGHDRFQKLCDEAEKRRKDQVNREEYQRRIRDIQQRINRQELTDAIDLAQQTLTMLGPDAQVSRLLQAARVEQEEKSRRGEQNTLEAVQTLIEGDKYGEATRMLDDAFANQILQPSHPRAKQLLSRIEKASLTLQSKPKQSAADIPPIHTSKRANSSPVSPADSLQFSATNVLSETPPPTALISGTTSAHLPEESNPSLYAEPAPAKKSEGALRPRKLQTRREQLVAQEKNWNFNASLVSMKGYLAPVSQFLSGQFVEAVQALKRCSASARSRPDRRLIIGGATIVALLGSLIVGIPIWRAYRTSNLLSEKENGLRVEAERLWDQHEPDQSEEKWKQIQSLHRKLENSATQQIAVIEAKRSEEQERFDEGNRLLLENQNDPQAWQILQGVADLHLWHAADAQNALNNIDQSSKTAHDLSNQEQGILREAEQLFGAGNYDASRRRFRDLINLQVPNSTLRPKAEEYLNKIRALNDDKKNYDAVVEDLQNENWEAARDGFRPIVEHKGALKNEAQKQLDKIAAAQNEIGAISELIRSHSYRVAKNKIDSMQALPKSSDRLRQTLLSTEQQEFDSIRSSAQGLLKKQDVSGLERAQDELNKYSSRIEDPALLRASTDLEKQLDSLIAQLKKELSGDTVAFNKAEKDYEQARDAGDINRLGTDVLREFKQIAGGTGYNHATAENYVTKIIPDMIDQLSKKISATGKAVVPPISCSADAKPTLGSAGQVVPCGKLDIDSPLQWIGNPTVDVPAGAKQAAKLPYTLHLVLVVDGNGKVTRVDKEGQADQEFLKKAKEASKKWQSTKPLQNGKPVSATFSIEINFQP